MLKNALLNQQKCANPTKMLKYYITDHFLFKPINTLTPFDQKVQLFGYVDSLVRNLPSQSTKTVVKNSKNVLQKEFILLVGRDYAFTLVETVSVVETFVIMECLQIN